MHVRKDENHNSIENLFRSFGYITIDTSTCHGDLLDFIAYKLSGEFWFVEVKNGNKRLTTNEHVFFRQHPEKSVIIRSENEALIFLTGKS